MREQGRPAGRIVAVALACCLFSTPGVTAAESPAARPVPVPAATATALTETVKKSAEPQPPVQISADVAEYFNKEGLVVFTGTVVATQADSTLTADRMEVTFSQPEETEGTRPPGGGTAGAGRRIDSIIALKRVSFRQVDPDTKKERYATGEKGVYDAAGQIMTMTGNPRLWEGRNVVDGEEMVFYLEDKKVIVKGKVRLTVYPDDAKEEKKP